MTRWMVIKDRIVVLIDTWWNVNAEEPEEEKVGADGFNRYMVECEFLYILRQRCDRLWF